MQNRKLAEFGYMLSSKKLMRIVFFLKNETKKQVNNMSKMHVPRTWLGQLKVILNIYKYYSNLVSCIERTRRCECDTKSRPGPENWCNFL